MSTLKALRSRIKSVRATQKITTAMKLVSAAKLRRAQEQLSSFRTYDKSMQHTWQQLTSSPYTEDFPSWLCMKEDAGKLVIVFMGDRGLCGSYNANMARYLKKSLEEDTKAYGTVALLPLGHKAIDALRREYSHTFAALLFPSKEQKPTGREIQETATNFIIKHLKSTSYRSVEILYTRFDSILRQTICKAELLIQRSTTLDNAYPPLFEPNRGDVIDNLSATYIRNTLRRTYLESQTSEQASRMRAMDTATNNANDVLLRLRRTYNRTRQAGITRELIEIVSGANALQT